MLNGELIECGPAETLLTAPAHDYSRALIAADPERWKQRAPSASGGTVLAGRGLAKAFGEKELFADFDIEIRAGEIVAIAGPSGCGKTTVGNILLGLVKPDSGTVERPKALSALRYQKLYQDPPAAFAPHQPIRKGLADLAKLHGRAWADVERLVARLHLQRDLLDRLPGQISGGELQRFALVRAPRPCQPERSRRVSARTGPGDRFGHPSRHARPPSRRAYIEPGHRLRLIL
jgi:peptide/nickel transport system ATP-binding protein